MLTEEDDAWYYKRNLGEGRFAPSRSRRPQPSLHGSAGGRTQLLDLGGDGPRPRRCCDRHPPAYFDAPRRRWKPFLRSSRGPNARLDDPRLRLIDLDGDGWPIC